MIECTDATEGSTGDLPPKHRAWARDPSTFRTDRVSGLRHNFHLHPLMRLSELAELAKELYARGQCRFLRPGATQASEFKHEPNSFDGRGIDEVFARIHEPGSWVALYNVEASERYRGFVHEVVGSVRSLVDSEQPGIYNVGGFIFISAPPSVTPFHIDRENNFWLQIAGRKTINVWDNTDRAVIPMPVVEQFLMHGWLSDVRLKDGYLSRSHSFDVGPGDGVYFPSTSPHMTNCDRAWVKDGDEVSISIGVVFYTARTRRHAYIHACNRLLRKSGLAPLPPGQRPVVDALKYPLGRGVIWALRTFGGYAPPPSFSFDPTYKLPTA